MKISAEAYKKVKERREEAEYLAAANTFAWYHRVCPLCAADLHPKGFWARTLKCPCGFESQGKPYNAYDEL